MLQNFSLIQKEKLTNDIFLLTFKNQGISKYPLCGQFMTFLLPKSWWRAYSILDSDGENYFFIIKRLEEGRGGSKEICDGEIGTTYKTVGPAWHFILHNTQKNKLFLWTGTGFVPLYFQIIGAIRKEIPCNLKLIFWLKEEKDIFFEKNLEKIKKENKNFDYQIYLSREENKNYTFWRITQFLTKENIANFEEFYICGNPHMIESVEEKLFEMGIEKEQIFTEKY
jgi:NAD(P)H-flavin reductase